MYMHMHTSMLQLHGQTLSYCANNSYLMFCCCLPQTLLLERDVLSNTIQMGLQVTAQQVHMVLGYTLINYTMYMYMYETIYN